MTEGFTQDTFDAKTYDVGAAPMVKGFAGYMVRFVSASIDVLDAGQRTKLAALIREHATKTK